MKTKRPGRPPIHDKRMKRVQVVLDENTINIAKNLGDGNMSRGVRELAARYVEEHPFFSDFLERKLSPKRKSQRSD